MRENQTLPWILLAGVSILLSLVLIIVAVFSVQRRYFKTYDQITRPSPPQAATESSQSWTPPISRQGGYPFEISEIDKGFVGLFVYSFGDHKTRKVNLNGLELAGAGQVGLGDTEPSPSKDFRYTAFIGQNHGLYVLSNETLDYKQVPSRGSVTYFTGWLGESHRFVYYVSPDTLSMRDDAPFGADDEEYFDPNREVSDGFYVFDVDTGQRKLLYPIEYVASIVDDDLMLVRKNIDDPRLTVFSVSKFIANTAYVEELMPFMSYGQFNFTADGSKWAFISHSRGSGTDDLLFAQFPNAQGIKVDSAGWAVIQFPIFSQTGKYLAYRRDFDSWVYDVRNGEKKRLTKGQPEAWLGDTQLVVRRIENKINRPSYYIFDLTSQNLTRIDTIEK